MRVTDETAYFWFFDPGNVELMVKALNACSPELGLQFWIFASGLTDVEVEMKVTDTLTGPVKTYGNPSGQVIAPILDIDAFATCTAPEGTFPRRPSRPRKSSPSPWKTSSASPPASTPAPKPRRALCLAGGRFQVYVQYQVRGRRADPGSERPPAHRRHRRLHLLQPRERRADGQGARCLRPGDPGLLDLRCRPHRR